MGICENTKDIWPIFGNKPKIGEQKKIISYHHVTQFRDDHGWMDSSLAQCLGFIICQRIRQKELFRTTLSKKKLTSVCPLPTPPPISCVLEHKDLTNLLAI